MKTGSVAKAERKNTISPSGMSSWPASLMIVIMAMKETSDISLSAMPKSGELPPGSGVFNKGAAGAAAGALAPDGVCSYVIAIPVISR